MSSALVMTPLRLPPPSTGRGLRRERRVERGIETNDIEARLVRRQERDPADLAQGHALTPRPGCRAARLGGPGSAPLWCAASWRQDRRGGRAPRTCRARPSRSSRVIVLEGRLDRIDLAACG